MKSKFTYLLSLIVFSIFINCKTQNVIIPYTVCPDLDTLFPVSSKRMNYEYYLDLNKFYEIRTDSTAKNYNYRRKKVEYGARRVGNDSLYLYINQGIGFFTDGLGVPDLLFISKNLDTDITLVYKIKNDPFLLSEEYFKKYGNSGVFIGESTLIREGHLYRYNYDKDFTVCVDEAIAIAESNTIEERNSKYFQDIRILRSEPSQSPFWIFTIRTNYGKNYSYTVDGITGKFEKANEDTFIGIVGKGTSQSRKYNKKMMQKRKDSIDEIFNQRKE